ncbi:MAG: hypothetical protein IKD53_04490 [Clostridia bacterium]|nr:hypothetical protein [Clostridia bacterium]
MPTTIKKIELYCPINCSGVCAKERCALYNDDVRACGLSPDSLQLLVKTAATDAAAEILRALGDDRR